MDPIQNPVPSPTVPPRAEAETGTTMPLPQAGGFAPVAPGPVAPPMTPAAAMPDMLPPTVPLSAHPNQPAGQNGGNQSGGQEAGVSVSGGAPAVADDGDLIEKEWVLKAKQIVHATQHDPYKQTKELHALKKDYMKKRYNKTIGQVDE